jgi:hypothetical protein
MTENNHESMGTVVETFLIEETVDLIHDNKKLEKWNRHVEELGLTGQTQIVKKDKSPIPFMHLKQSYVNICSQLCPREVPVETYNITPIPVEILDLVALSKKDDYFEKIKVWYDDKSPDPFVVGMNYSTFYSLNSNGNLDTSFATKEGAMNHMKENGVEGKNPYPTSPIFYLLGKWADVKHSWDELKEMAIKRFTAEKGNEYHKRIKEAKRGLEDIEMEAFDKFN